MKEKGRNWRFGAVGNIIKSHIGDDGKTYYGTKAFKGGTKVYLDGKFFPSDAAQISVIGLNRYGKYAIETVPTALIENVRFKVIHDMTAMKIMDYEEDVEGWKWWGRTANDKREAKAFVQSWYLRENRKGGNHVRLSND